MPFCPNFVVTDRVVSMHRFGLKITLITLTGLGLSLSAVLAQSGSSTLRWPAKTSQETVVSPSAPPQSHTFSGQSDDVFSSPSPLGSIPTASKPDFVSVPLVSKPVESAIVELEPAASAPAPIAQPPRIYQSINPSQGQAYQSVVYVPKSVNPSQAQSAVVTQSPIPPAPIPNEPAVKQSSPISPEISHSAPKAPLASLSPPVRTPPPPTPNNLQEYRLPPGSKYATRLDKDHILVSQTPISPSPTEPLSKGQTEDIFLPSEALHASVTTQSENASPRIYSLHREYGYQPDQITLPDGDNSGLLIPDLSAPAQDNTSSDGLDEITPVIAATRARAEAAARSSKKGS